MSYDARISGMEILAFLLERAVSAAAGVRLWSRVIYVPTMHVAIISDLHGVEVNAVPKNIGGR
jgi:hypothetical protein